MWVLCCCPSSSSADQSDSAAERSRQIDQSDSAAERSRQIDQELRSFRREYEKILHLLLLGAGECGKSTVIKQMRIIYTKGFDDEEKAKFVEVIRDNTLRAIARDASNF